MKAQRFKFDVERVRSRAHRILFDNDSPFKPSKVERRDRYERRGKHRGRELAEQL